MSTTKADRRKADMWMPLYIADYLADTMRLTTEQHGAYLLLLMDYWRSGPLPDNDQVLASIVRLPLDRWIETRGLLAGFFSVSDGFWVHGRADAEIAKAQAFRERQRANGSKGGRPKQPSENPRDNPRVSPEESPSPSQSQEHVSPSGDTAGASRAKTVTVKDLVDQHGVDPQVAADFLKVRKGKRLPLTPTALNGLIREFRLKGITVAAGIKVCAEKGWAGFKHTWEIEGVSNGSRQQGAGGQSAVDRVRQSIAERDAGAGRTFDNGST